MKETNEAVAERARQAKMVLEHDLVKGALESMRDKIRKEWEAAPARDIEGREDLWKMLKLVNLFEGNLKSHINSGKFANDKMVKADSAFRKAVKAVT